MRIFLLRHGETEWNRLKLVQGHMDTALSENGREQARCFRHSEIFQKRCFASNVYTSDLQRCRETAEIICEGSSFNIIESEALREKNHAWLEGKSHEELLKAMSIWDNLSEGERWTRSIVGEESNTVALERVLNFLKSLEHRDSRPILIVTHGGILRLLYLHATGLTFARVKGFENLAFLELEVMDDEIKVVSYNGHKSS